MTNRRFYLLLLAAFAYRAAGCQAAYRLGVLPQINLTAVVSSAWKCNLRLESRQIFSEGRFDESPAGAYRYERTDLACVLSRQTGVNSALGAGYLIRIQEEHLPAHRFIQQFSAVMRHGFFRTGHRFSADQTIRQGEAPEFRFRYRFSVELPLQGQSVDPGEFYTKLNHEYLAAIQQKSFDLETRVTGVIGLNFNDRNKLESGLDYRVNEFLNAPPRHQFWLYFGWFLTVR